jgi:galactokinase
MKTIQPSHEKFISHFGAEPMITVNVPGRVNLMGDHTDYNGGLVLPITISRRTQVQMALRKDKQVRVLSDEYPGPMRSFQIGKEKPGQGWLDYIQGVTHLVSKEYSITGFDIHISTDIPIGSGLSSSAALEIALLRGLRDLLSLPLGDLRLAQLGQTVETDFVGAPVGIMDQMAVCLGDEHHALYINTRTLEYNKVAIPDETEIIIIHSGITHQHATGGYKKRREECREAEKLLAVPFLTDLTINELPALERLPPPLNQRVKHVVTENNRVIETVRAFQYKDVGALKTLFYQSHESLRKDYAVSTPEIDTLIEESKKENDVIGARLTGGGFGGSIVILAYKMKGLAAAKKIIERSVKEMNFSPRIIS